MARSAAVVQQLARRGSKEGKKRDASVRSRSGSKSSRRGSTRSRLMLTIPSPDVVLCSRSADLHARLGAWIARKQQLSTMHTQRRLSKLETRLLTSLPKLIFALKNLAFQELARITTEKLVWMRGVHFSVTEARMTRRSTSGPSAHWAWSRTPSTSRSRSQQRSDVIGPV